METFKLFLIILGLVLIFLEAIAPSIPEITRRFNLGWFGAFLIGLVIFILK